MHDNHLRSGITRKITYFYIVCFFKTYICFYNYIVFVNAYNTFFIIKNINISEKTNDIIVIHESFNQYLNCS